MNNISSFRIQSDIMTTSTANTTPSSSAYESMKHEVDALSRAIAEAQITSHTNIYNQNESKKSNTSEKDENELSDPGGDCNGHTVIIDIEEKALKCDKRLLTQHSKYFEALFSFQEIPTNRIRLKGKLILWVEENSNVQKKLQSNTTRLLF